MLDKIFYEKMPSCCVGDNHAKRAVTYVGFMQALQKQFQKHLGRKAISGSLW